jgi:hypothetical protein
MTALAVLATDAGGASAGAISAAGGVVGLLGVLLAAVWLHYLYR